MTNEMGNASTYLGDGWLVMEKDKNNLVLVKNLKLKYIQSTYI